jgi:hypothetical protein
MKYLIFIAIVFLAVRQQYIGALNPELSIFYPDPNNKPYKNEIFNIIIFN